MDVKDRLAKVLQQSGMTQSDFALSIGTTQATLSRQLKGIHKVDKQAALALQAVFNINPDWLLSGTGEMFIAESQKSTGDAFDPELMERIITIVTQRFNAEGLEMPPDKFAKFILFMYNRHKDKGGVTEKDIEDNVVLLKKFA